MPIAFIDFLNSREDAILFWAAVILLFAASKDPRGISTSFLGVLRASLHLKLLLLFGSTAVYCAVVVFAGTKVGLWHVSSLKPTIYWYVGTGIVLVGYAATHSPSDPRFLRHVLKRVVALTILIEFIANVYVLPFGYELVLAFLAILFALMQVLVQRDRTADLRVQRFVEFVLVLLGLVVFTYFAATALRDLDGFLTRENVEAFLVGPVLTIALIPFLYATAWVSRWEQRRLRERFRTASGAAGSASA